MNSANARVRLMVERAKQRSASERAAFLDGACEEDSALRAEVEHLLAVEEQTVVAVTGEVGEQAATAHALQSDVGDVTPSTEAVGSNIGRYRLLEKIGEGGFGSVWAAEQREPVKRRVALKIIKLGMDTKQVVARFEAERQALALMDHPNIAKVLDAGATETGRPYFVMELVKGIPITKYCDQEKLNNRARLGLYIKVCQAIQHAHQKGIIHRDVKPSNILVTLHDGVPVPKVIDFGIAKATQQELTELTIYTRHQQFIGTPAYMSPEQAEMSGLDIDTRSDIYSLGVLLYELLTGSTPFDTKELVQSGVDEMRRIIREREPVRPSTRISQTHSSSGAASRSVARRHTLSSDLDWIVMKCLEKDRTRRYETANGLAADLKRHLNDEPVTACPPSLAYRVQRTWRRHRLLLTAGVAIGLVLLLGAGVSSWQAVRATKAERKARDEAERALEAEQNARALAAAEAEARHRANRSAQEARLNLYAADLKFIQLAITEDDLGRAVALLDRQRPGPGDPDWRGFEWRYLWQQTQGQELASLSLTNLDVADLDLSPDQRWLAAGGKNGVSLVNVATWEEQRLVTAFTNGVSSVDFSPDGEDLVAGTVTKVALWDTLTWELKAALPGAVAPARFSPDGRTLLSSSPAGLQIRDARSLTLLHQLPAQSIRLQWGGLGSNLAFSGDGSTVAALIEDASAPLTNRFSVRVWDVSELRAAGATAPSRLITFPDVEAVISLALSEEGRRLAATTTLGVMRVWDTLSGELVAVRREPVGKTRRVAWRHDRDALIGVRSDQTIRAWRRAGTNLIEDGLLKGHLAEAWALTQFAGQDRLATGDRLGVVKLWSTSTLDRSKEVRGQVDTIPGCLSLLQFLSDHRTLVALAARMGPGELGFWDTDSGRRRRVFTNVYWHAAARIAPHEQSIAIARTNGLVEILDLTTQAVLTSFQGPTNGIRRIFFTPDSQRVLTGTPPQTTAEGKLFAGDTAVQLWDASTGQLLQTTNLTAPPGGMALAPDGETFAVQMLEGTLEIRRTRDFSLLFRRANLGMSGPAVAYSPDGRLLAVTDLRGSSIQLWDIKESAMRFELRGHTEIIHSVAFAPDGHTLASASHDKTIKLWSNESGQELLSLPQDGGVFEVAFSGDGSVLAAGTYQAKGANQVYDIHLIRAPTWKTIQKREQDRHNPAGQSPR